MCDPISASIALTVAGTTAQAIASNKAKKAMQGATNAERIRQKGYEEQSQSALNESQSFASKAAQDRRMAEAGAARKAEYDQATAQAAPVATTGENLAGDQAGNSVVASETSKRSADATNSALQKGAAMANLQGFGDLQLGNALYNNRIAQRQAQLGNFMRGSADVLPLELQAASQKGKDLATLGQLLNAAGAITGMGAGAGWWGGADTAAKTGLQGATVSNVAMPSTFGTQLTSSSFPLTSGNLGFMPQNTFLNAQLGLQPAASSSLNFLSKIPIR
jgi:hypothetical protein